MMLRSLQLSLARLAPSDPVRLNGTLHQLLYSNEFGRMAGPRMTQQNGNQCVLIKATNLQTGTSKRLRRFSWLSPRAFLTAKKDLRRLSCTPCCVLSFWINAFLSTRFNAMWWPWLTWGMRLQKAASVFNLIVSNMTRELSNYSFVISSDIIFAIRYFELVSKYANLLSSAIASKCVKRSWREWKDCVCERLLTRCPGRWRDRYDSISLWERTSRFVQSQEK